MDSTKNRYFNPPAWVCARLFLRLNGKDLNAIDEDKVATMLEVAAGKISEIQFAEWLRLHGWES